MSYSGSARLQLLDTDMDTWSTVDESLSAGFGAACRLRRPVTCADSADLGVRGRPLRICAGLHCVGFQKWIQAGDLRRGAAKASWMIVCHH